jgi:hypothetical protein
MILLDQYAVVNKGGQSRERAAAKQAPDSRAGTRLSQAPQHVRANARQDRDKEPDAGKPHVRIREGGRRKPHPYLDSLS